MAKQTARWQNYLWSSPLLKKGSCNKKINLNVKQATAYKPRWRHTAGSPIMPRQSVRYTSQTVKEPVRVYADGLICFYLFFFNLGHAKQHFCAIYSKSILWRLFLDSFFVGATGMTQRSFHEK